MLPPPYLTDQEISDICQPLVQPKAQINYMRSLGMVVKRKPSGRALVAREEFRRVTVLQDSSITSSPEVQPNRQALNNLFGARNGAKT